MPTPPWRKSSYCQEGEACVHISSAPTLVRIADDDPPRNVLAVGVKAFGGLLAMVKTSGGR
ncbi:DUF397 domain-containing protein [Streptomyces sp. NPDC127079]|uniref:DUF397 domain-containing protein n=1 Tax=Streptomyces sp. NPDC127079 TaxID=3347132 RepID=UPI003649E6A6